MFLAIVAVLENSYIFIVYLGGGLAVFLDVI